MGSIGQPTMGWFPWMGVYDSNAMVRTNNSTFIGMGYLASTTQGSYAEWKVWMDSGTWKVGFVTQRHAAGGIIDILLDGVSQGTIDTYGTTLDNDYRELTGISVATPGLKTLRTYCNTKNASSSNYQHLLCSMSVIKTAGAHSTPAGSDTPGTTWVYLPWMGSKANTNWSSRDQNSGYLGGGQLESTGAQNAEVSFDVWLEAGTYKYAQLHRTGTNLGIYSVQLDGVEQGTIDGYAGSTAFNVYNELTGISVATAGVKTFKLKMATKNASSASYVGRVHSCAWIKTA